MTKIKTSQTILNTYEKYLAGEECGEYLKLVFIEEKCESRKSVPMAMGERFEYEALGNRNRKGNIPEAFMNMNGSVSAKQKGITVQSTNFREWMIKNNYRIISKAQGMSLEFDEFFLTGIADAIIERDGEYIIMDLKYSGNLNNKDSEWGWHPETLLSHKGKIRQMIIYLYLLNHVEFKEKKINKFIFYVASSSDENQFVPFEIVVSDEAIEREMNDIIELAKQLSFEYEIGLTARPTMGRCQECPAKDICTKKGETQSTLILNF